METVQQSIGHAVETVKKVYNTCVETVQHSIGHVHGKYRTRVLKLSQNSLFTLEADGGCDRKATSGSDIK